MSAPDFYFAVNAMFRHIHETYGRQALESYWRALGTEYYAVRAREWGRGGLDAVCEDWHKYFEGEPGAQVTVKRLDESTVELDVRVCPAIKHLRESGREIVPYFCDHCDHICSAMGAIAGLSFVREGGMGSCRQRFVQLSVHRRTEE